MSLIGRIAWAIWRRFESTPGVRGQVEHQKRVVEISIEAERAACSSLDDSQAKTMLAARLSSDLTPTSIAAARARLVERTEYISERAYRLLTAIVDDCPVAPVPQEMEQRFMREEALGRMPLDGAFQYLAEMEPRLRDVEQQMSRELAALGQCTGLTQSAHKALIDLVGVGVSRDDTLLSTNLAASIARQYLEIRGGITSLGNTRTSYFDAPLRIGVRA
jgi:hypothetical protein